MADVEDRRMGALANPDGCNACAPQGMRGPTGVGRLTSSQYHGHFAKVSSGAARRAPSHWQARDVQTNRSPARCGRMPVGLKLAPRAPRAAPSGSRAFVTATMSASGFAGIPAASIITNPTPLATVSARRRSSNVVLPMPPGPCTKYSDVGEGLGETALRSSPSSTSRPTKRLEASARSRSPILMGVGDGCRRTAVSVPLSTATSIPAECRLPRATQADSITSKMETTRKERSN
jgi:hypothetical protein